MDGITVLNEITTVTAPLWLALLVTALAAIFLGLFIAALVSDESELMVLFAVFTIILGALSIAAWSSCGDTTTRYEVTIESGAIIDATKWEIVEQRGEIYVIESREAE